MVCKFGWMIPLFKDLLISKKGSELKLSVYLLSHRSKPFGTLKRSSRKSVSNYTNPRSNRGVESILLGLR
ncbi:hypothetical protein LIER_39174 [Lithospermum erythrorhizon]|uniref:Uncharacterized protein n=1 Tax=Lithospermum erythrorhizon TaxID=34254 RepID=A0AAV3QD70_LITER